MKKLWPIVLIYLLLFQAGCQKNEDSPVGITFDLLEVPDRATNVGVTPTLSWQPVMFGENEARYDLYIGKGPDLTASYLSGIATTSVELNERLNLHTDYYWKVVAKDNDGNEALSPTFRFTTRNLNVPESPITQNAGFSPRIRHTTTVFDNKLWVIGGASKNLNTQNDVWSSPDGVDWTEVTANGGFPKKNLHSTTVFDNKLWIIGGYDGDFSNDVWYSSDGANWVEATSNAAFSPRFNHRSFVFDNKLWVIGGVTEDGSVNDIWYTLDGNNWSEAMASNGFPKKSSASFVVFDNKVWAIGGFLISEATGEIGFHNPVNDVWNSDDGIHWNLVASDVFTDTGMPSGYEAVVYDDQIWLFEIGFLDKITIWRSDTGENWQRVHENLENIARSRFSLTSFDDTIWMVGGQDTQTADYLNSILNFD